MNKKEQIPPEEIGQKGNSIINNTYKNLKKKLYIL